jgi:hypothetical protein
MLASTKVLNQRFVKNGLVLSYKAFFGRCQHIVENFFFSCAQMTKDGIANDILVQSWLSFHYYDIGFT